MDLPIARLTSSLVLGILREIEARGAIETAKRTAANDECHGRGGLCPINRPARVARPGADRG
ncbi:hypothetical protein [Sphingomonas aerolata]|uniref:hypothetical protein n=1 Tax=Sphingomonas aerolata TaxID=185951 RepID=UPI0035A68E0B